ncbi:MAG: hypothetical protein JO104_06530 [Candidatus Eremiobacteraeota bacterium]|nr:hypothetical protein [Candidatus Eremiobacteraeota bacterium]
MTPPPYANAVRASSSYAVAYSFSGPPNDGWVPTNGLADNGGVLYGLTGYGGSAHKGECSHGCGTFFAFDPPSSRETVIYSFHGPPNDGALPNSNLAYYKEAFYGASWTGGASNFGTIFELKQRRMRWKERIIYSFKGPPNDGNEPTHVNVDRDGTIYGTTFFGGSGTACLFKSSGCGTLFRLTPSAGGQWHETVLYSFEGSPDGAAPLGELVRAAQGTMYGETKYGGRSTACPYVGGCGTIFQLKPHGSQWRERVLHSFNMTGSTSQRDGSIPSGLMAGADGMLYGTTAYGGKYGSTACDVEKGLTGCGTFFAFVPRGKRWNETILYAFKGGSSDGAQPAGATPDGKGGFYGTTAGGGVGPCQAYTGCGTLYHITAPSRRKGSWNETILHSFEGAPSDGWGASSSFVSFGGAFYGTTGYGGSGPCAFGCGTIFAFQP